MAKRATGLYRFLASQGEAAWRQHILDVLELAQGNVTRAAYVLDISRRQLIRLIKRATLLSELERIRVESWNDIDQAIVKLGGTPWTKTQRTWLRPSSAAKMPPRSKPSF
jgi:hypothetical protein